MSKHGYYNSRGEWCEQPCNAFCRGDHHAAVIYTNAASTEAEEMTRFERQFTRNNLTAQLVRVSPATEAPPLPEEYLREEGYRYDPRELTAFLVIFAAEPRP